MSIGYRALLLDLSGVLYEGNRVIEGAEQVIAAARKRGLILRFVTNTATKSSSRILDNLKSMGMDVNPEELYTAPMAARDYLQQQGLRPYCLIHEAIRAEFEQLEQTEPDSVLLGDARDDLSYQNLNRAFALCKNGAPLIGIGMNKYFQDEDGLKLDAGAFIHAIEWAADVDAIIMGKPSAPFFEQVVASTGVPAADCLMVGDDVLSDVVGAMEAGLQGCLVQTGKYRPGDEKQLPPGATMIASVAELQSQIAL